MSVIAKFVIREIAHFGTGQLVSLSCWCDNDMMAAYAVDEQDKLFTKYSPSGDMRLSTPEHFPLGQASDEFSPASAFYVVVSSLEEAGEIDAIDTRAFPGAALFFRGHCKSLTDFGAEEMQVEYRVCGKQPHRGVDGFNWKMSVNNPGAYRQMKPRSDCWIAFYDAAKFDRNAALAAAHGRV